MMAYEGIFIGLIGVMALFAYYAYTMREAHPLMSYFFVFVTLFMALTIVHLAEETLDADGTATTDMKETVSQTFNKIMIYGLRFAMFYFIIIDFFFMKLLGLAFSRDERKVSISPVWTRRPD